MANFNKGHEGLKNAFLLTPTSLDDPVLFNSQEGLKTIETYGGVPKEELLRHVLRVVSSTPTGEKPISNQSNDSYSGIER